MHLLDQFLSVVRCRTALLLLCFFDLRHPGFWDFNSFVSFDVVRVTPHMNCLFHPACVEMGITINGIYFAPERAVSGVVGGVLRRKATS